MLVSKESANALNVIAAVMGAEHSKVYMCRAEIVSSKTDRYGMKMEIIVPHRCTISGRFSKNHNFTGIAIFTDGKVKKYKSANAWEGARKTIDHSRF